MQFSGEGGGGMNITFHEQIQYCETHGQTFKCREARKRGEYAKIGRNGV
jgi:hypothetical protein